MYSNANKAATAEHQHQITGQIAAAPVQPQWTRTEHNYLTTDALADTMGLQAQSVRKRYSQTGSYFGLKPVKLANRRLMWDADAVAKFLRGEGV
ncbi:DNA-binding protein [Caballeronia sp. NCTM1]|uniref:DNA-binding protein n=1 Tax=Caballeronia sp. NCTM1 TaxID=2921753 RepID=UPI002027A3B9|nr:DNA-binding protein [Caballeronia sp. NCTM1]